MANEINIGINTTSDLSGLNKVDESVKSLKTQLKEAEDNVLSLSNAFGATSKEAVAAAQSAAMLKNKIGDAKNLTDAFNPGSKFKALNSTLTGVTNAFGEVTGALGKMGVESKGVEQAITKVQDAMALAGGVEAIGESIKSFTKLSTVIKNTTIFQRIATAAQWLWNAALNANPIGAIIVAITALIGVGYLMVKMFKSSNESVEASKEAIEKNTKAIEKETEALEENRKKKEQLQDYELRLMKARGKSDEAIAKRAIVIAKENEQEAWKEYHLKRTTLEMAKNTIATYESTQAKVDDQMASVTWMSTEWGLLQQQKDINKQDLKLAKEKLNSLILSNNSAAKVVDEAHNKRVLAEQNLNVLIAQNQTNANKESLEKQKKLDEDKLAKLKELKDKLKAAEEQKKKESAELLKAEIKETEDLLANTEVKKENLRHQRQLKEIEDKTVQKDKKKAIDTEEYNHSLRLAEAKLNDQKALDEAFNKLKEDEYNKSIEFMAIQDAGYQNDLQKQLEHYEHLKIIQQDYGKSTIEIDQQIADAKKEIQKKEIEQRAASIDAVGKMAVGAAEIGSFIADRLKGDNVKDKQRLKTAVRVGAASSIAGVIGSTMSANAGFLANPASIATMGLAAAVPIATSLASSTIAIANILSEKTKAIREIDEAGGDTGGGGKATPSKFATGGLVTGMGTSTSDSIMANLSNGESVINAKSTAMFGNLLSNINQMGGGVSFGNQNQTNPIFKTYVVASEMTSQIEANLKLKQIARL